MKFVIGNPPIGNYKIFDDDGADITKFFTCCQMHIHIHPDKLNSITLELTGSVEVEAAPENVKAILNTLPVAENGLHETTAVGDEYRSLEKPK